MRLLPVLLLASTCLAQGPAPRAEAIRAHVKFLSSDGLEGRGPGEKGGELAAEYLAAQFAVAGLEPAGDAGTFFQKVPLSGVTTDGSSKVFVAGSKALALQWLNEFVGVSRTQKPAESFEADVVFAGHGIVAPEFQWDDYKGVDVRGKIVLLFTNEPPSVDPKFFGGRALTYYGRWTYKFEQAQRMGARAAFVIHTTPTAGYGWSVVRNSWGREDTQVKLQPGQSDLSMAGWLSEDAAAKILKQTGRTVSDLLKSAENASFKPVPLGFKLRVDVKSKVRDLNTRNVVGMVKGSDPALAKQAVVYSAHWDHLGVGTPVNGDTIYNGAVDNGTGCGILVELARAWASQTRKPKRSAIFVAVTSEEGGLRGSEYYALHAPVASGMTAVALNYDGLYPFGTTEDIVVTGAERTTFWPVVQRTAKAFEYSIQPDSAPEQGFYYRSDHFSFARLGVPSFSINQGMRYKGKAPDYGEKRVAEYEEKHYHQPSDEFHEDWDFSGMAKIAAFGMALGVEAANAPALPTWRPGDEFLAARVKSTAKAAGR